MKTTMTPVKSSMKTAEQIIAECAQHDCGAFEGVPTDREAKTAIIMWRNAAKMGGDLAVVEAIDALDEEAAITIYKAHAAIVLS